MVAPIAALADSMWAASRTPYPRSSRPSHDHQPGRDDERGGRRGALVVSASRQPTARPGPLWAVGRVRDPGWTYVTALTKKDQAKGLSRH